jgi:crotonobetainyl-CoA:carnitine CoA-transferase CaiB-like acyl-CoA transferase
MSIPSDRLPKKSMPGLDLLSGITVLEITSSVAGPYSGQLLADLGATVIKIEKPIVGDDCRAWGPPFLDGESLWFISVNRNKSSVTLDYTQAEGYRILAKLVVQADVVVVNMVSRAQKKLKIDYETLKALKPSLIHVSITGFGLTGAKANMPCYDLIAEGYSGVMDMTGEPESGPQKVGTPAADLLSGQDAAYAAVAALFRKERTGKGCQIDISLVESMTRFMSPRLVPYLGSGEKVRRSGARDSVIAIYQVFETADESITLGLGNDNIWMRFWAALGDPEFAANAEYSSNASRRKHRAKIVEEIANRLLTKKRAQWLAIFAEHRIPAGPVNQLHEIAEDSSLAENGFIYSISRDGFNIPQVGLGIKFDGNTQGCDKAPPMLGEDTQSILAIYAGLTNEDMTRLRDISVI